MREHAAVVLSALPFIGEQRVYVLQHISYRYLGNE
jgi:hypothetical protein